MNRLGEETSPYLRQHRDNPVDWYPWGEEAFGRAREEDRPILLSVGYSACHWCHVMAHESFEDPILAELQNRLFVNIKVDREERPDVDRVYMDALQALTGGGGWPMTVFLLPDGRPFFAGTYFPPEDRSGLPGFRRVLESLSSAYRDRRQEVVENAERLSQALLPAPLIAPAPSDQGLAQVLAAAEARLVQSADPQYGGFSGAPKFPQCAALDFLLTREVLNRSSEAGTVVRRTLQAMAEGGIRDQLGEGFHRYSVDRRWAVPHFEKMLYDNAQLVRLYLRSWQAHRDPQHLDLARRTADFLIDQMGLPQGGFAASLDADTPEGEGAFYAWTEEQMASVLGPDQLQLAQVLFGGEGVAKTEQGGSVLRGGLDPGLIATRLNLSEAEVRASRESMVQQLARSRASRTAPGRDDKLIVGWNALAISALTELALGSGETRYLDAALRCAEAILSQAMADGLLHHLFDGSRARFVANLDDLAGMGLAALALHEATGEPRWFDLALALAERVEREYRDPAGPGWFDTPLDHDPNLKARPRSLEDGAQPSGTSLMTELCLRLHALTGVGSWIDRAVEVLTAMASAVERFPSAFGALLSAMALLESGQIELALLVPEGELAHWPLLRQARSKLRPQLVVGVGRVGAGRAETGLGPPLVHGRPLLDGLPTAYVCRQFACRLPVVEGQGLDRELEMTLTA
ncbi:MAG: thioredoxin domain-containing protein [Candidatus Dormiibacterota bacterium]